MQSSQQREATWRAMVLPPSTPPLPLRQEGSSRRRHPPLSVPTGRAASATATAITTTTHEPSTGLRGKPSGTSPSTRAGVDAFDPQLRPELHYLHDEVAAARAGRGFYHHQQPPPAPPQHQQDQPRAARPHAIVMSSPNPWEGARRREEWPSHNERSSRRDTAAPMPPMPSLGSRRREQYAADEIKLFVPPRSAPRLTPTGSSHSSRGSSNNQIIEKGAGPTTRSAPAPAAMSPAKPYASPQYRKMRLPEGMLHLWIYQARHLVFKRLFESMYERHGLRLRVYVTSRRSGDVSEIFETRRNYGGNMANPRWRRDKDDARDNKYGHFCIPLIRATLREDTELMIEIVCGILVVAHARVSLPALLLGSFGTTPELLASQSVQFRPHWFPLAGDDSGLLEISLEFISARLIRRQQESQQQHRQQILQQQQQHEELYRHMQPRYQQRQPQQQPESELDAYEEEYKHDDYDGEAEEEHDLQPHHREYDSKAAVTVPITSIAHDPVFQEEQRQHAYDELERHERHRRQRFEMTSGRPPTPELDDSPAANRGRSTTASSTRSTRFQLPPTILQPRDDQQQLDEHARGDSNGEDDDEDASSVGPMRSSDDLVIMRSPSISGPDDDPSEYASVSTAAPEERMINKQLWELYCYGLADDGPSDGEQGDDDDDDQEDGDGKDDAERDGRHKHHRDPRDPSSPRSDGSEGRKLSMSEVSGYSMAFSDVSEASVFSRDASTCCSEILSYNDRIQRMEDAIRAARERRSDDDDDQDNNDSAPVRRAAAELPRSVGPPQSEPIRPKASAFRPPSSGRPTPAPITTYGWERPAPPRPAPSPASSEPIMDRSKPGVVLFDPEHIPVKGDDGQPDPALAAYRAKMLARRRSLPVKSLAATSGMGMGLAAGAWQPPRAAMMQEKPYVLNAPSNQTEEERTLQKLQQLDMHVAAMAAATAVSAAAAAAAVATTPIKMRRPTPPPLLLAPAVEELVPAPLSPVLSSLATEADSCIDEEDAKETAAAAAAGPPPLRRKRSSSLHSVSDLLRDHVQIHNLNTSVDDTGAMTMTRQQHESTTTTQPRQRSHSRSRQEPRGSQASSGSSGRESDASSSSGSQIVPMVVPSGAPLRVRRNSKGINVVHINGVMVGVGKFINVGTVPGVIRYIGPTLFAPGLWIGVELTERKGKHNGTVQNVQYFECAAEHGIFIRAERLDVK